MTNTSINISGKIEDPRVVALLTEVQSVANKLDIQFFVVGAMARDIVLWYAHGFLEMVKNSTWVDLVKHIQVRSALK